MRLFIHALMLMLLAGIAVGQGQLSVQEAVDMALKHNPDVLAARNETEAANAGVRSARAPSNPEILITPGIVGEAGSDEELSIAQPLEVNGQRQVRTSLARAESDAAQASYLAVEREVVRSVKQMYWEVVQAHNVVELSRGNVEFLEALLQAANRQVEVGTAPGAQRIKAQVELTRAGQDLMRAESDLAQARASLNTLLGRSPDTSFEPSGKLEFAPVNLDPARLKTEAQTNRPELAGAKASLAARKAEVKAVEVQRRPDLSLQYRQETLGGDGGAAVGISIPLLDWGSIREGRRKAQAQVEAQEKRIAAVETSVALDVDSGLRQVKLAEVLVQGYQQGVLSQAEQLADMAQKGYKSGANSYLEVLEAQRTLRNVKTEYHAALADHLKALAQLEWAVGSYSPNEEVTK